MRTGVETLAKRDRKLVVEPSMYRKPLPGVGVLGWDADVGSHMREILQAPRIGFTDRHGAITDER